MEESKKRIIKRSLKGTVMNAVFRGDDYKTFTKSIWKEQIMPMLGDILEDCASRAIRAVFYEDEVWITEGRRRRKNGRRRDHDYGSHSKKRDKSRRRNRTREDIDDDDIPSDLGPRETGIVPFDSLGDVEDIIDTLARKCDSNGEVSTKDFYSEANIATTNFQTSKWGWTDPRDIRRAKYKKLGGKYYIDFPPVENLEEIDRDDIDDNLDEELDDED